MRKLIILLENWNNFPYTQKLLSDIAKHDSYICIDWIYSHENMHTYNTVISKMIISKKIKIEKIKLLSMNYRT